MFHLFLVLPEVPSPTLDLNGVTCSSGLSFLVRVEVPRKVNVVSPSSKIPQQSVVAPLLLR